METVTLQKKELKSIQIKSAEQLEDRDIQLPNTTIELLNTTIEAPVKVKKAEYKRPNYLLRLL